MKRNRLEELCYVITVSLVISVLGQSPNVTTRTATRPTVPTSRPTSTGIPGQDSAQHGEIEYAPYDGWYNNFAHPDWGASDTALLRKVLHAYGDGVYSPSGSDRPNPIEISQIVFNGSTGSASYRKRTALLVFFGQQMVEEIIDAQLAGCPPEYFNIPIPRGHPEFDPYSKGGREIPLLRTRYDQRTGFSPNVPREQLNEVSSYFDGTLMYGPHKAWADALRLFKWGRLKSTRDMETNRDFTNFTMDFPAVNTIRLPYANPPPPRDHVLKDIGRFWTIGNPRGNENPFLLTFGVLWYRYHNYKAHEINRTHPKWSDEKIFNEARKWTIAVHAKITYYDWIPMWLGGPLPAYGGYDPHVHPQIAHVFQSAAGRFGHTLVPPGVYRRIKGKACQFRNTTSATKFSGRRALRTCNTYWNPQEAIRETDIDELLMGMASQISEREDNIITPDLRGSVFGALDFNRRDLMAVNIQRGRDHGLPDYNTARAAFGLPKWESFTEFANNHSKISPDGPELFKNLEKLCGGNINKLDIWPGGMLETTEQGPGDLFRAIITDQFTRIRTADRFWFENNKMTKLFTDEEVELILRITIKDVIVNVTGISADEIQNNPFMFNESDGAICPQPVQLNASTEDLEPCTPFQTYDYFDGSKVSYTLTLIGLFGTFFPILGTLLIIAHRHNNEERKALDMIHKSRKKMPANDMVVITALEWIGKKEGQRSVSLVLNSAKKQVLIKDSSKLLRTLDVPLLDKGGSVGNVLSADRNMRMMIIQVPKEYDLVLIFSAPNERQEFLTKFKTFLSACGGISLAAPTVMSEKMMKNTANTRAVRQATLETFFAAIFSHALDYSPNPRQSHLSQQAASDIVNCELTKYEFAEALGLRADSMFVENMFKMVDKNDNGYISFREFLDFFVIFSNGSADQKAKLMFDMYDLTRSGDLSKSEFKMMLRSLVELANENVEDNRIDSLIDTVFKSAKLDNLSHIKFDDFQRIMSDYSEELSLSSLDFKFGDAKTTQAVQNMKKRENAPARAKKTMLRGAFAPPTKEEGAGDRRKSKLTEIKPIERSEPTTAFEQTKSALVRYVENYRRQIVWLSLYSLIVAGIFIERAHYYSVEREHAGLRRMAGYGVTITRGAASVQMFTYSTLLVTMCRNIITRLRETFLNRFIPFDSAVEMHKIVAMQALFFTIMHIVGHCINFYHIATQPPFDLACLFRNYFFPTHFLPKFHFWCWNTLTGVTGVLMTIQLFMIYIFGTQYARRNAYRAFWITHNTYPLFFILMILHGAGRLVQAPFLYYFLLGPVVLFAIDQLISVSRKKVEIPVVKAELLPSDVTYLEFRKPANFDYRSGQWVRIACLAHSGTEYHPFTLTSSPHESTLSVHVRAVGPWTRNIRRLYDPELVIDRMLPQVYLDGPYGEGHQDWYKYEVSILVGGGIGVTPFASILKQIAHSAKTGQVPPTCKKVYFIWVTRTQRHFEWLTEIIREVEIKDKTGIVSVHVFITQFKEKFDFRTTMLFICERHFQKISERSLFTGLKSITHFGRPDFVQLFQLMQKEHPDVKVFGVFSCGPPPMTRVVEQACSADNKFSGDVLFEHHYENF